MAAIDINQHARDVYLRLHAASPASYLVREIESISPGELAAYGADCWWLSPPCQPYTRRGRQRDLEDPRAASLLHLLDVMKSDPPEHLCLENVGGFRDSNARELLEQLLSRLGYQTRTFDLCPSQLGWPNLRPRFYLLASRSGLNATQPLPQYQLRLADFLNGPMTAPLTPPPGPEELWLTPRLARRFESSLNRLPIREVLGIERAERWIAACFGSSYGKALVKSGSYLQIGDSLRRFTPNEVAALLGFEDNFDWNSLPYRRAWKLLGNSLSLPVVRYVVAHLQGGPTPWLPQFRDRVANATARRSENEK